MSVDPTVRLKLTLAYRGTRFQGWQVQNLPDGGGQKHRTVQGCLEEAMSRILKRPVRVQGAGRTDAGVHAMGQCAHADVDAAKASMDWQRALNALLPKDMCVVDCSPAEEDFHALRSATSKTYAYSLWRNSRYVLPQRRPYVWPVGPLDIQAMDRAAAMLVGEHDFASFRNVGTPTRSTVRTVSSIERQEAGPDETVFLFTARGFLKQMVRNLMGCLVAVGRGKLSPEDAKCILAGCDRSLAPATAPAQGLTLLCVRYGDEPGG